MTHVGFQAEIAGIIEHLANAAVAEICKVVENGYAVLHVEISQTRKQNEALKRKLLLLEAERNLAAKYQRERGLSDHRTFRAAAMKWPRKRAKPHSGEVQQLDEAPMVHGEDAIISKVCEPVTMSTQVTSIKEESHEVIKNCSGGTESCSPRIQPLDTQISTADLSTQMLKYRNLECIDNEKGEEIKTENMEPYPRRTDDGQMFEDSAAQEDKGLAQDQFIYNRASPCAYSSHSTDQQSTLNLDHEPDSNCNFPSGSVYREENNFFDAFNSGTDPHQDTEGLLHMGKLPDIAGSEPPESSLNSEAALVSSGAFASPEYPVPHQRQQRRWFVCNTCGKAFSRRNVLLEHQRSHSGDRRFVCTLCGKSFNQVSSLKKHHSIHTGEKPFRCLHCGKRFSDSSNLRKHVNIHTGERPFRCGQCGKTFNQSSNLRTHMKIHTGEKPFSCECCGQVFAYKISLVNHKLKSCEKTFTKQVA